MRGTKAKRLRKEAFKLYPEGSTVSLKVTHTMGGVPVAGHIVYGGYRRAYQNLKKGIHETRNPS
jgi:hypothetical protein